MKIVGRIPPTAVLVITHLFTLGRSFWSRSDLLIVAVRLWRLKK
jgi:hypothetical protein